MTDTTIADIAREKIILDNSEWFEGQDGTGSFKSRIQSIRGTGEVPLTTSAVSQDVGPDEQLVLVTSSGTGLGTDAINLALPTLDGNGFNGQRVGQRVIIELADQVDPADQLHITVGGSATVYAYDQSRPVRSWTSVWLDFPGGFAVFVWTGYTFALDVDASSSYFEGNPGSGDYHIQAADVPSGSLGSANQLSLQGGLAQSGKGGPLQLYAADSNMGDGGDIEFKASPGGSLNSMIKIAVALLPVAPGGNAFVSVVIDPATGVLYRAT